MDDESLMPWGKYKGDKMINVPASYLLWLYDMGKVYGEVKEYIKDNLEVLQFQVKQSQNDNKR